MIDLSRAKKPLLSAVAIIALLYVILLIPGGSVSKPEAGAREPFLWNSDDYFSALELSFVGARSAGRQALIPKIENGAAESKRLLDSMAKGQFEPSDPLFDSLETRLFELAPLAAALPEMLPDLIDLYNSMRIAVKKQSIEWNMNDKVARHRIYRLLYGGRAAVEEAMLQSPKGSYPELIISEDEPSMTPSAEIRGVTVHSGDILVSRGGAPTSALIARGNDYPGNFSHVALVYVDDSSGIVSIIESHIEIGVKVATVDEYIGDTKLRIMVLRMRADHPAILSDPMLPHRAAWAAYRRAFDQHIPYDFEMDYGDPSKLFCSEVASAAYTQYGVNLWAGISNISSPGVRSWLAAFGVKYFQTQEPSDLEYDPQLSVVAEWRDPETLYKDHLDNAVIDVMLEGAERGDELEYDWYKLPLGRIVKLYCLILNTFGGAGPIPEGMGAEAALTNDRFSKTHAKIKKLTILLADKFESEKGYRPPYWELVKLARAAEEETR